jgi:hypothetical protein
MGERRSRVASRHSRSVPTLTPLAESGPLHIGDKDRGEAAAGGHSSGIPALRRPTKKVASNKARILGTPKGMVAFKRVMLE